MRNMVDEASCLAKRGGTPRLLWIAKGFCTILKGMAVSASAERDGGNQIKCVSQFALELPSVVLYYASLTTS